MPAFERFAPYYTVLAILVFIGFRLYGGMWQFAGINDMNRIIGANALTTAIQIVGTTLVFPPVDHPRMPLTYYLIGALLQFIFIAGIRFGYRILLVEKRKVAGRKASSGRSSLPGSLPPRPAPAVPSALPLRPGTPFPPRRP